MNVLANNIYAMNANRMYQTTLKGQKKITEKMSSGYRINKSADDAAGLAISEKMRKQIRGLSQAAENCQDGISMVQVADGALNETHAILQRMNELAVQSANGTNSNADRAFINEEKKELISELNRIANTTAFNGDVFPLRGNGKQTVTVRPDRVVSMENVSIDDVKLLGSDKVSNKITETYVEYKTYGPFSSGLNRFDSLSLQAVIDDKNGLFSEELYRLLYENGNTSYSRIRLRDASSVNPELYDIEMSRFTFDENSYKHDSAAKTWERSFSWRNEDRSIGAKVTQKVRVDDASKNYIITNEIQSIGTKPAFFEFMVNLDTAYNEDDSCEGYYANKKELTNYSIYNTDKSKNKLFQNEMKGLISPYLYDSFQYPDSISIVNRNFQNTLPFTEKITFLGEDKPVISIGDYRGKAASWDYYKAESGELGKYAVGTDRTTTLIWSTGVSESDKSKLGNHEPYSFTFAIGVDSVKRDKNLPASNATITYKEIYLDEIAEETVRSPGMLKIHAGASSAGDNGIFIRLADATADSLGVSDIDLSTQEGSRAAIDRISMAIEKTSRYRSYFGAIQNRMEHTIKNLDNVVENTQSAESSIRDMDMAKGAAEFFKTNIFAQADQYVLAQANQMNSGVLSLLQ